MTDITVQDVHARLGGNFQFIDVRQSDEVAEGMIPGARHIALGELQSRIDEIDKDIPAIMICRSGQRSGRATEMLAARGYQVENMVGGMLAWAGAGYPIER